MGEVCSRQWYGHDSAMKFWTPSGTLSGAYIKTSERTSFMQLVGTELSIAKFSHFEQNYPSYIFGV